MWIVGVLQGADFRPLADAPTFRGEGQAAAWALRVLANQRLRMAPSADRLTWRAAG